MATGESRKQLQRGGNAITEVSWTGGTAQDVYYGIAHSFQYSSNINTDDELHGLKLSTRVMHTDDYKKCQLVSLGDYGVMALPVDTQTPYDQVILKRFQNNGYYANTTREELNTDNGTTYSYNYDAVPGVVFQDRFWFGYNTQAGTQGNKPEGYIASVFCQATSHSNVNQKDYLPYDHYDYTDESIEDASQIRSDQYMQGKITAILNYNNTRLVVACGQDLRVYYPELDHGGQSTHGSSDYYGTQGRKKVLTYEPGVTIVALTCTFEYLKVRAVDEGRNTKVYYYQGNNNLRSTFVYNLVDLTGVRVTRVYSINGIDYYTSSIGQYASDALVDLNKLIGATPVKLFTQRAGLTDFDINHKAPYFVGPTSIGGAYNNGNIYIADAYGVFSFKYSPDSYDKGYMKRQIRSLINGTQVYGLCENKGMLYVSTTDGCYAMRLYDTGVDGYQEKGVLISRELEGDEGGTITKMLEEIRLNYELNPLTIKNGNIDIYVSPNNLWKSTSTFTLENNRWHVMHIEQRDYKTRTQKSNLVNSLQSGDSSFKFDWQTITYAIVITKPTGSEPKATPIVRQIDIRYRCKDKIENVYNITKDGI